jgi:hypothetical protein
MRLMWGNAAIKAAAQPPALLCWIPHCPWNFNYKQANLKAGGDTEQTAEWASSESTACQIFHKQIS